MGIFGPPAVIPPAVVAIISGQTLNFAENTSPVVWEPPTNLSLDFLTGVGVSVGPDQVFIDPGFQWVEFFLRAGFASPADGTDNGVGYRAITMDNGANGAALCRMPAVSSLAAIFTGFNGTVVSGGGRQFLNGSGAVLSPGFQHTAGAVNRFVGLELHVRLF